VPVAARSWEDITAVFERRAILLLPNGLRTFQLVLYYWLHARSPPAQDLGRKTVVKRSPPRIKTLSHEFSRRDVAIYALLAILLRCGPRGQTTVRLSNVERLLLQSNPERSYQDDGQEYWVNSA
jgi:hypothetical protein